MDPNIKIVARSITNLMLVGVLLSLIGALVLFARLLSGETATLDAVNAWSGAAVLVGAAILCFRYGFILDRQQRSIAKWQGLLIPFHKSKTRPLSKACFMTIASYSASDPSKATRVDNAISPITFGNSVLSDDFLVRLEDPGGGTNTLRDMMKYDEARRFAEEIAKFLDARLRDRSSLVEVDREAGELDLPLREQLRRTGQSVPLPAQIEGARAIFSYGGIGAATSIAMPAAGMSGRTILKAVLGVCTLTLIGFWAIAKARLNLDTATLLYLLAALFLLFSVLALRELVRAVTNREELVVSPDGIVVSRHGSSDVETTRLTSAEIEEIVCISLRCPRSFHDSMSRVVIRSDRGSIELGATLLQAAEVGWLRDVLLHVLTPISRETKAV